MHSIADLAALCDGPGADAVSEQWLLKLVIEEDEDAWPAADRFMVWIAPASDRATRVQHHLCIGSGATRAAAVVEAETELRGALTLLAKASGLQSVAASEDSPSR